MGRDRGEMAGDITLTLLHWLYCGRQCRGGSGRAVTASWLCPETFAKPLDKRGQGTLMPDHHGVPSAYRHRSADQYVF